MNESQESVDSSFYFSAVQIASEDPELRNFMDLYVHAKADHEAVEAFVHDEGFVDFLGTRYGLSADLATSAFMLCHQNALSARHSEQNTGTQ